MITRILLFYTFLYTLTSATGYSQKDPRLIIDPQGHSAKVNKLAFSPDGNNLVSISDDKSIRIWNVAKGELERTLRPYSGGGSDGRLYAAALSPNGRFLAIGGYTVENDIRIIDLMNTSNIVILKGHNGIITDLEFDAEGYRLASASEDKTIKIWTLTVKDKKLALKEAKTLEGHTAQVYDVAFSPDGKQLVSGSYDTSLRLWNLSAGSSTLMKMHFEKVQCVAFSPDGKNIISGSSDSRILVWDNEGNYVKELDKLSSKAIGAFSFTADGRTLIVAADQAYAYDMPGGTRLHRFTMHNNTVSATASYKNQFIATADASSGKIMVWKPRSGEVQSSFGGKGNTVWAVATGKDQNIAMGFKNPTGYLKDCPLEKEFNFSELLFKSSAGHSRNYTRSREKSIGTELVKMDDFTLSAGVKATIKNKSETDGRILSYSLAPGKVVVGSDFSLKLYNQNGSLIKDMIGHNGPVWALAVTDDGKTIISASGDQTLRFWNAETGEALAALFVSEDNEWICWSPYGYYAASAGGEKYIGWQVNKGTDQLAEFFPAYAFRKKFLNPQLIKLIFKFGSFEKAMQEYNLFEEDDEDEKVEENKEVVKEEAEKEKKEEVKVIAIQETLPPSIQWLDPVEYRTVSSNPTMVIKARIVSQSQIQNIKLMVNGRPAASAQERGFKVIEDKKVSDKHYEKTVSYELDLKEGTSIARGFEVVAVSSVKKESNDEKKEEPIPVIPVDLKVEIWASNSNASVTSEARLLRYESPKPTAEDKSIIKPNLYLLTIGISSFANPSYNLTFADADAKAMSSIFKAQKGKMFNDVYVVELFNEKATRAKILDGFHFLKEVAKPRDVVMIFIATHGMNEKEKFYILPHDGNHTRLHSTAVNWSDFSDVLSQLPSKVLLMLDACHSGQLGTNLLSVAQSKPVTPKTFSSTEAIREVSSQEVGVVVMSASTGSESALEHAEWGHGAFTKAIIEGLEEGKADIKPDGIIYLHELEFYTIERVKELTNNQQHPTSQKPSSISVLPIANFTRR